MTETEWLADKPPEEWLLDCSVSSLLRSKASERKSRLFAVACCRRVEGWLTDDDESCRHAIEIAEKHADGQASKEELALAYRQAAERTDADEGSTPADMARAAAYYAADPCALRAAEFALEYSLEQYINPKNFETHYRDEEQWRWRLLHDILGNPFQPSLFSPGLCTSTVEALAPSIYQERAFGHLPILADALEDAGCTDAEILNHCRQLGEHVRGCWVVDLLLDKR
jgi:hypothetical protein